MIASWSQELPYPWSHCQNKFTLQLCVRFSCCVSANGAFLRHTLQSSSSCSSWLSNLFPLYCTTFSSVYVTSHTLLRRILCLRHNHDYVNASQKFDESSSLLCPTVVLLQLKVITCTTRWLWLGLVWRDFDAHWYRRSDRRSIPADFEKDTHVSHLRVGGWLMIREGMFDSLPLLLFQFSRVRRQSFAIGVSDLYFFSPSSSIVDNWASISSDESPCRTIPIQFLSCSDSHIFILLRLIRT